VQRFFNRTLNERNLLKNAGYREMKKYEFFYLKPVAKVKKIWYN
jgi:hypothetical protein